MCVAILALGAVGAVFGAKQESRYQGSLPCDDLQRCMNKESRGCWKKFYMDGRKKDDLVGDVLKACPENEFMDFVDRTEAELWPEFSQVDKNLTECMTEAGFKSHVEFCGNMRSVNYSRLMEKTVDTVRKESQADAARNKREDAGQKPKVEKPKDESDKCWINALNTCVNQYPPPNEEINTALSNCEDDRKIAADEERLGFEVGKRVMLKIVTKLKEAFDKEDTGDDDDDIFGHSNSTATNRTQKATTPKPHAKP